MIDIGLISHAVGSILYLVFGVALLLGRLQIANANYLIAACFATSAWSGAVALYALAPKLTYLYLLQFFELVTAHFGSPPYSASLTYPNGSSNAPSTPATTA